MPTTEPAPSSDDLDPDLHRGLDRELDLASERPSAAASESPRGPGLMVAAIVASSLALAGVITLVRGDDEPTPAAGEETEPAEPEPEVARAIEPPPVVAPPTVATRTATPAAAVVPVRPRPSVVPPPPRVEPTPAAIAKPTRSPRRRIEMRSELREETERSERFDLPAPRFDEPAEEIETAERSPDAHPVDAQAASHSPTEPDTSAPPVAAEPSVVAEPEPASAHDFEPALPSSKPPGAPPAVAPPAVAPEPTPAQAPPLGPEPETSSAPG